MPEGPEVETIRRKLEPSLSGQKVLRIEVRLPRIVEVSSPFPRDDKPTHYAWSQLKLAEKLNAPSKNLSKTSNPQKLSKRINSKNTLDILNGQNITSLERHGKYLQINLTTSQIVVHLGMTGSLTWCPPVETNADIQTSLKADTPPETMTSTLHLHRTITGWEIPQSSFVPDKHTHVILIMESGSTLLFRDPRTFGKILFFPDGNCEAHPRLSKLGPDPLSLSTSALTKRLIDRLYIRKSNRPIKASLLDQEVIAGVGNIYADEALFRACIHPSTHTSKIHHDLYKILAKSIQDALKQGIQYAGTSFSDYRHPDGGKGSNQERLLVYGREGEPCKKCRSSLIKTVIAGRGTVYCEKCQK